MKKTLDHKTRSCVLAALVGSMMLVVVAQDEKAEAGWTCKNGWWYEGGTKSTHSCADKGKDPVCTNTENAGMPKAYPRTCIKAPPNNGVRCW
jgi:hypothetical protein